MTENHYLVLNCEENATYEEIKQSYQKLVKQHHPDKQEDFQTSDVYRKVDEAWRILRDSESRKEYDAKLMNEKMEEQILIYATLNLDELNLSTEQNIYTYNCRCGGLYIVDPEFIVEDECIVNCDECSFVIKIIKVR